MQILDCAHPTLGEMNVNSLMPHPTAVLGVFIEPPAREKGMSRIWVDQAMFNPVRPVADCTEPQLAGKLTAQGYTHVIVRHDFQSAHPPTGFEALRHFADSDVYRLRATPATVFTREIEGFWWRAASRFPARSTGCRSTKCGVSRCWRRSGNRRSDLPVA